MILALLAARLRCDAFQLDLGDCSVGLLEVSASGGFRVTGCQAAGARARIRTSN